MDYFIFIISLLAIISSFLAIEVEDRIKSILLLLTFSTVIGVGFIYVGALYSGIFQLLVYSGVITVLFAATAYFVSLGDSDTSTQEVTA
jgi:NADH:ubiquinone oxidoreductase subunit 6 (subunit J)